MDSPSYSPEKEVPQSPDSPETVISMMLDQHGRTLKSSRKLFLHLKPDSKLLGKDRMASHGDIDSPPRFNLAASALSDSDSKSRSPFKALEDESNARSGFTEKKKKKGRKRKGDNGEDPPAEQVCNFYVPDTNDLESCLCSTCGFREKDHKKLKGAVDRLIRPLVRVIAKEKIERSDCPWLDRDIKKGEVWYQCHQPFWQGPGLVMASQNTYNGTPCHSLPATRVFIDTTDLGADA